MGIAKSRRLMGKDKFEQYVFDQFKEHELSIDTDSVFAAIEKDLPGKAALPWGKIILSSLSILLISALAYNLYTSNSKSPKQSISNTLSSSNIETTQTTQAENKNSNSQAAIVGENSDEEVSDSENQRSLDEESENQSIKANASTSELNIGGNTIKENRQTRLKENNSRNQESKSSSKTPKEAGQNSNLTKRNISVRRESQASIGRQLNQSTQSQNRILDQPSRFEPSSSNEREASESTSVAELTKKIVSADQQRNSQDSKAGLSGTTSTNRGSNLTSNTEDSDASIAGRSNASILNVLERDNYTTELLSSGESISLSLPNLNDCYSFNGKKFALAFDLYGGFHLAQKVLKNKSSEPTNSSYASTRGNSEKYLEAFDAGISINMIQRSGFIASIGVNYRQINEKLDFLSVNRTTKFDSVVVRIVIDSSGSADTIKGWEMVTVQTTREILTYNRYRMVDIPLSVGFQFRQGQWTIEPQVGVMFNVLFQKKGEYLDEALDVDDVAGDELFKDRMGISLFGGVKILYPVSERVSAYLEPYGRFNVKDITVDNYQLNQRYNSYGVRLGARIML